MKFVVAIDSFKGSLSSMQSGIIVKDAIELVYGSEAEITVKPLADGGEGTVDALVEGLQGEKIEVKVTGPLGKEVKAVYGLLSKTKTAIIEMASAAGITLVEEKNRNPLLTTTYGVGEMIKDALAKGCRNFIIGIGGSATNDGGIGMLQALGAVFSDESGNPIGIYGQDMLKIRSLDCRFMLPELKECNFQIACDVNNPLCGFNGASHIYGPQKGATPEIVLTMDAGLKSFSDLVKSSTQLDLAHIPGTGAAGGLGYAFLAFLQGKLQPGIDIVLEAIKLNEACKDADYVVTGEGKLDFQTSMGKAPIGVARLAKKSGCKVLAFCGCATKEAVKCNEAGIDAYFPIIQMPISLAEAMDEKMATFNLFSTAEQVFRLLKIN